MDDALKTMEQERTAVTPCGVMDFCALNENLRVGIYIALENL